MVSDDDAPIKSVHKVICIMVLRQLTRALIFLAFLQLAGCFGGANYAPVVERQERISSVPAAHLVNRGETLYSIAWRYSLDFKGLARTNNIAPPYIIYPGQSLRLKTALSTALVTATPVSKGVQASDSQGVAKTTTLHKKPRASRDNRGSDAGFALDRNRYPFTWRWPAKGKMIRRYSSSSTMHKGIDIKGKLGDSVYAANSGKIVYAGSGLVGYGKLLIIKHDDHYLSAYGHNSKLLVSEGELVKVGQRIAKFGDTGTDKVKLHFEIRKKGKPVNPLGLLSRD